MWHTKRFESPPDVKGSGYDMTGWHVVWDDAEAEKAWNEDRISMVSPAYFKLESDAQEVADYFNNGGIMYADFVKFSAIMSEASYQVDDQLEIFLSMQDRTDFDRAFAEAIVANSADEDDPMTMADALQWIQELRKDAGY